MARGVNNVAAAAAYGINAKKRRSKISNMEQRISNKRRVSIKHHQNSISGRQRNESVMAKMAACIAASGSKEGVSKVIAKSKRYQHRRKQAKEARRKNGDNGVRRNRNGESSSWRSSKHMKQRRRKINGGENIVAKSEEKAAA